MPHISMNGNFDKFVYSQGFILINTKNIYFFAKEKGISLLFLLVC